MSEAVKLPVGFLFRLQLVQAALAVATTVTARAAVGTLAPVSTPVSTVALRRTRLVHQGRIWLLAGRTKRRELAMPASKYVQIHRLQRLLCLPPPSTAVALAPAGLASATTQPASALVTAGLAPATVQPESALVTAAVTTATVGTATVGTAAVGTAALAAVTTAAVGPAALAAAPASAPASDRLPAPGCARPQRQQPPGFALHQEPLRHPRRRC